jgi:N-acetylmuramic acid 6-phosphate etherase
MVLHLLSTAVMVRLGYVSGNLMTHLLPASDKLRERGVRIVMSVTGVSREEAIRLLAQTEDRVPDAIARARGRAGAE